MKKKIIYIILALLVVILGAGIWYFIGSQEAALSQDQQELVEEFGWPSVFSLSFSGGSRFELWAYHDFAKTFIFDDGQFQITSTSEISLGDAESLYLKPSQFKADLTKEELIKQLGQPTGQIEIPVSDKKVEYLNFGNELIAIFRDGQISTIQTFAKNPTIPSHLSKLEKRSIYQPQLVLAKGSRWDNFVKWLKDVFFITAIQQFSDSAGKVKMSQENIGKIGDGDIKYDKYSDEWTETYENKEWLKAMQRACEIGGKVYTMPTPGAGISQNVEDTAKLVEVLTEDTEDYVTHKDETKEFQDARKEQKQILETEFGRENPSDLEAEILDTKTRIIAKKMGKDTKGKSVKSILQDTEVKKAVQSVYRKKPAGSYEALMQRIDDSIKEIQEELEKIEEEEREAEDLIIEADSTKIITGDTITLTITIPEGFNPPFKIKTISEREAGGDISTPLEVDSRTFTGEFIASNPGIFTPEIQIIDADGKVISGSTVISVEKPEGSITLHGDLVTGWYMNMEINLDTGIISGHISVVGTSQTFSISGNMDLETREISASSIVGYDTLFINGKLSDDYSSASGTTTIGTTTGTWSVER